MPHDKRRVGGKALDADGDTNLLGAPSKERLARPCPKLWQGGRRGRIPGFPAPGQPMRVVRPPRRLGQLINGMHAENGNLSRFKFYGEVGVPSLAVDVFEVECSSRVVPVINARLCEAKPAFLAGA